MCEVDYFSIEMYIYITKNKTVFVLKVLLLSVLEFDDPRLEIFSHLSSRKKEVEFKLKLPSIPTLLGAAKLEPLNSPWFTNCAMYICMNSPLSQVFLDESKTWCGRRSSLRNTGTSFCTLTSFLDLVSSSRRFLHLNWASLKWHYISSLPIL